MRFAFASFGSLGDLHPVLALACEAKARGHEVVVGAATHHQPSVEAAGLEFGLVRPEISMAPELLEYFFDLRRGPSRLLRELVFANARESFEDLWRLGGMADVLVVGECLYGAPMAAEKLGIPWANLILAPTSFLSATDPGVLPQAKFLHRLRWFRSWFHRVVNALGRLQTGWWARPHYQLRRSLGLAAGGNPVFDAKHSPCLTLAMFPEFLQAANPTGPLPRRPVDFPFTNNPAKSQKIWLGSLKMATRRWFSRSDRSWRISSRSFTMSPPKPLRNSGAGRFCSLATTLAFLEISPPRFWRWTTPRLPKSSLARRWSFTPVALGPAQRAFERESPPWLCHFPSTNPTMPSACVGWVSRRSPTVSEFRISHPPFAEFWETPMQPAGPGRSLCGLIPARRSAKAWIGSRNWGRTNPNKSLPLAKPRL